MLLSRWTIGFLLAVCLTLCCGATEATANVAAEASGAQRVAAQHVTGDHTSATVLVSARSVPPAGWRRTVRGWERLDAIPGWAINEWIRFQKVEESNNRLLGLFESLSVVHPISFAAAQLAVAFLLAAMSRRRSAETCSQAQA